GSTCHGAGRVMSRGKAKKMARSRNISAELKEKGILVRADSRSTMDEEMPEAYKDVSEVVDVVEHAGISRKIAQLKPLCVIKG
ncbi:MAG: RtcB family protein, partial [Planctomycetes bacterium]|nr:RtcB family protein [Planctomycetota bacterium]